MPQTKVEKKFSRVGVGQTHYNLVSITRHSPSVDKFQGFPKNIARGEE